MKKLLALGVWLVAVSLGTSYVVASVMSGPSTADDAPTYFAGLDYRRTDGISIPMIEGGAIRGYVLARFVYTIDGKVLSGLAVPPEPFVLDEAFRVIYSMEGFDAARPERYDLAGLTGKIRDSVNARFGSDLVREVLVEQFDFLPKNELGGEGLRADHL